MTQLTIGDFARASGLSAKALRLYDEMGLLRPAEVDPVTGYRRYDVAQLDRARLVARLRLAGLPLARIRVVADLPPYAAAVELTSYWRQVEADVGTARGLVGALVVELHQRQEHEMSTQHDATSPATPQAALRSGIGARDTQQDAAHVGAGVYAVADGFGGAVGLADDVVTVVAGIDPVGDPLAQLDAATTRAAALVVESYADHPDGGTTLTALVLRAGSAFVAHLGDSRAYLVRDGRLERLTRDHTVVQTLVDEGRLTPEEARSDDRRVQLNRAIGVGAPYAAPDLAVHGTRPGDRFVLTTDGVHGELEPDAFTELVTHAGDPASVVAAVAAAVEATGADDNYHVLVVDLPG